MNSGVCTPRERALPRRRLPSTAAKPAGTLTASAIPSRTRSATPSRATVGNAVTRNRIRRRLREIYRLHEGEVQRGYDVVVVARHRAGEADYHRLERDLMRAFASLSLLKEE